MEADFQSMHADMNDALNARRAADERSDRLQMEVNRLTDELRQVSQLKWWWWHRPTFQPVTQSFKVI